MWVLLVVLLKLVACQKDYDTDDFQFTTNDQQITVTYNPGQDCLPYDDSVVPDCSKYIDPVTKEPYYHTHSKNCSRFWECGPGGETCLFECAHCGGPSNPMCNGQWALTFDPKYQYPNGPVCDWPSNIDCITNCTLDEYQCCENSDCNQCDGGYCSLYFQCVYPEPCGECKQDSDCDNWDGTCNVPAPHDPDNCAYCSEEGTCLGGCGGLDNDLNCPDGYHCNQDTHLCESGTCDRDEFCEGYDQMCNANYDNCFFCGGDCGSDNGCCPGCHDNTLNCKHPTPICNQDTHLCGCTEDADCVDDNHSGFYCEDNTCKPECQADSECAGYNAICNVDTYENCFYCSNQRAVDPNECAGNKCCTGCAGDDNCPYPTPVCQDNHGCGCNDNDDCEDEDVCNTDLNKCEKTPDECQPDTEADDCNADVIGVCDTDKPVYTQCFYCDTEGSYNQCKPGCSNGNGEGAPQCPASQPVCMENTHVCSQDSGARLLRQIVFTSQSCEDCVKEGVDMTLTGTDLEIPQPMCKTDGLDNPQNIDYVLRGVFTAEEQEVGWGWGTCYQSPLNGEVTMANVTWVGEGTWTPDNVCFDWDNENTLISICRNTNGASLSTGGTVELLCETPPDLKECP